MPTNCVWLDGLSTNLTDQYLTRHFCRYGPVVKVSERLALAWGSLGFLSQQPCSLQLAVHLWTDAALWEVSTTTPAFWVGKELN